MNADQAFLEIILLVRDRLQMMFLLLSLIFYTFPLNYSKEWNLAMNISPSDGNIMDYCSTYWYQDENHSWGDKYFDKDYVSDSYRTVKAQYIAVVRHNRGTPDAVKVWRFKEKKALVSWFDNGVTRTIATQGGDIYWEILGSNKAGDPIFSVDGDLAFNWIYYDNGCRIALSGGYLAAEHVNDHNTHGIGVNNHIRDFANCVPDSDQCRAEVTLIQDCPLLPYMSNGTYVACGKTESLGNDSTGGTTMCDYTKDMKYGDYAIYVSEKYDFFPMFLIRILTETVIDRTFFTLRERQRERKK